MAIFRFSRLAILAILFSAALAMSASATLVWSSAIGGLPTGVSYVNFDDVALGNAAATSGGIAITFDGNAEAVQGTSWMAYAAPFLSNNNGVPFGDSSNGEDETTYLSAGNSSISLALGSDANYLGLLWGSVDDFNSISFYSGSTLVGSLTGLDVSATADGDQGLNGTYYVNIYSTVAFDTVVLASGKNSFEVDNVAFTLADHNPIVPEPASLALIGIGISGFAMLRRRSRKG